MKRWLLAGATTVLILSTILAAYIVLTNNGTANEPVSYTYSIVNTYPHDPAAFTEGLAYDNGALYEGTGLVGESSLRKVDLATGVVLQHVSLGDELFGEGITVFNSEIIQLTWQNQKTFFYDKDSFNVTNEFTYHGEGWGLTHDDTRLIMSNGSAILSFLDPIAFKVIGTVQVHDGNTPVENLNELEYINGDVYANVWLQNRIAIINIQTGQVKGWINLAGLSNAVNSDPDNVLNGIAYDAQGQRLFVTGKRWPQLFQIKLVPIAQ